jgi:uncharacterized protein
VIARRRRSRAASLAEAARGRITARRRLCALVTGAASGVGKAFAAMLADKGHDLVLVDIRGEELSDVAGALEQAHAVGVKALQRDLSDPAAPADIVATVRELGMEIDLLVNNAGLIIDGAFLQSPWVQQRAYQQVLALTPAELIHRLLPGMLERGFGQVVNVGSVGGLMPSTPFTTLYGPCKSHLIILTRTLQAEYGRAGITFSVCCPGAVTGTRILEYSRSGQAWSKLSFLASSAEEVAEKAYAAVQRGTTVRLVGPSPYGVSVIGRLVPADAFSRALAWLVIRSTGQQPIEQRHGAAATDASAGVSSG